MSDSEGTTRRSFVRGAGLAAAGLGLGSVAGTAWPEAATASTRLGSSRGLGAGITRQLDQAIPVTMRQAGIPGAIVGLWTPGGSYVRAFGISDKVTGAPMQTGFYMRIGSETKTFTASAILQLVDQGKLHLDDPIGKYIPNVPDGDRITIRELARMQSGLYPYTSNQDLINEAYSNPQRSFTPGQLLGFSFSHPLDFQPGTNWEYDNTNYVLMGLVVEKLSGQPLGEYFKDHLFRPFGLRHTTLPAGSEFPAPHPHGYTINFLTESVVDATDWNPSWGWAAGAMISTLSDLRRWAPVVATGRGLLTPATQAQRLQTVHVPGAHADVSYGLGLLVNAGWRGHNGSLPGYESVTVYLPAEDTTMVLLLTTDTLVGPSAEEPSSVLGTAITSIATPGHVYGQLRQLRPMRAENPVHGSDQQVCSPGVRPVMIIDHVPAVRQELPPRRAGPTRRRIDALYRFKTDIDAVTCGLAG